MWFILIIPKTPPSTFLYLDPKNQRLHFLTLSYPNSDKEDNLPTFWNNQGFFLRFSKDQLRGENNILDENKIKEFFKIVKNTVKDFFADLKNNKKAIIKELNELKKLITKNDFKYILNSFRKIDSKQSNILKEIDKAEKFIIDSNPKRIITR